LFKAFNKINQHIQPPNGLAHATSWCRAAAAGLARLFLNYAPLLAKRACA